MNDALPNLYKKNYFLNKSETLNNEVASDLEKIVETVKTRWPILSVAVHHRTGRLQIGEVPVVIAVSTPHRSAGFEACQFIIDTLKETVPIWKKEFFEDGEVWVAAHP